MSILIMSGLPSECESVQSLRRKYGFKSARNAGRTLFSFQLPQCFSDTKHDSPMIPLKNLANPSLGHRQFPPKFRNSNLHNITHSEISQNPRERMFLVQILLFIVTFFSLISRILSLMQTTKEVNTHPCIAPCTITWSVNFFFLCHLLDVGACHCHVVWEGQVEWATPTEVRGE